jgi:hypothetical protein
LEEEFPWPVLPKPGLRLVMPGSISLLLSILGPLTLPICTIRMNDGMLGHRGFTLRNLCNCPLWHESLNHPRHSR